ncbi:MAG: UDP-N-acetylmuramoyl-tripeptide--D-alanyl-D-alanine ligase [Thiothrix sp.]|nr:MAG: UDP-N-acetylmuramoyl-tripeptide--D-alanyl-D-alanine ligase [Thiothrix sp.]
MSWLKLSQAAEMMEAGLQGVDAWVDSVSTDTRKPVDGSLFFALQGPNFDAHEVLGKSPDIHPAGLVVSRPVEHPAPQIVVNDTRVALGGLAAAWRQRFTGRVVALTGSNGKTTVKEMLAAIFAVEGPVLSTEGNLNNNIGVPLTLLRLRPQHLLAVIEMGANHSGEIAYLSDITRPNIALLNNAAAAHLEGFGDIEGVAHSKGEIFSGLCQSGVAVINADDDYCDYWVSLNLGRRRILFGSDSRANVRLVSTSPVEILSGGVVYPVDLQLEGEHNAYNAMAAWAVATAVGIQPEIIQRGLASMRPVKGRLQSIEGYQGATVIDDSYNANPASLQAGIKVLAAKPGKRILVLGDMAELGANAVAIHAEIGTQAARAGIERLMSVGVFAHAAVEAFGNGGRHFQQIDDLLVEARELLDKDTVVLVKGSRAARMERVVEYLSGSMDELSGGQEHAA